MLVSEANRKRKGRAWLIAQLISEKVELANLRIKELEVEQAKLKLIYENYLYNWKTYIQPLQAKASCYVDNNFEIQKLEKFLQGQKIATEKYEIGKTSSPAKAIGTSEAYQEKAMIAKFRALSPEQLAKLEKLMGS